MREDPRIGGSGEMIAIVALILFFAGLLLCGVREFGLPGVERRHHETNTQSE